MKNHKKPLHLSDKINNVMHDSIISKKRAINLTSDTPLPLKWRGLRRVSTVSGLVRGSYRKAYDNVAAQRVLHTLLFLHHPLQGTDLILDPDNGRSLLTEPITQVSKTVH